LVVKDGKREDIKNSKQGKGAMYVTLTCAPLRVESDVTCTFQAFEIPFGERIGCVRTMV